MACYYVAPSLENYALVEGGFGLARGVEGRNWRGMRSNLNQKMQNTLSLVVVIPTKNRPDDLVLAVRSILAQTTLPTTLVIIDQSDNDEGKRVVTHMAEGIGTQLVYILDANIRGLVAAKSEALRYANGDIICFLEDDVVLELDYLAEIEAGFLVNPKMLGCCGLVVDMGKTISGYVSYFQLFHRGIFFDPRVGVHGYVAGKGHALIPSHALSGGLSAWRRQVFDSVKFDIVNDFFMLEDIEFSTRAAKFLGGRFYVNPNARLDHRVSPVNREKLTSRQRRKVREYIVFYKKRKGWKWATTSLLWLLLGLFLVTSWAWEKGQQCAKVSLMEEEFLKGTLVLHYFVVF